MKWSGLTALTSSRAHSWRVRGVAWLTLLAGCAEPSSSIYIDPDAVGTDQGTLVSIADIRNVAGQMIESMNASSTLAELRRTRKPLRVAIGNVKNRTSIAIFDKELFVNRLLASLSNADLDGSYAFLRRDASLGETGEVLTGADLVLSGEIRELLHRETVEGGGELEQRTVQYSLALTRVSSAEVVWADSREVVKQQITGAVYR